MNLEKSKSLKTWLKDNFVVVFFLVLAVVCYFISGVQPAVFLQEIVSRFQRNAFLILALIIPVIAGLGLNFGMVIGAIAGQIGILFAVGFGFKGFACFLMACLISTPLAVVFGWMVGFVLNKTKGNEMITSMILGYLANGIYQLVFLVLVGRFIPFPDKDMLINTGIGIRSSLGFEDSLKYSVSDLIRCDFGQFSLIVAVLALVVVIAMVVKASVKKQKLNRMFWVKSAVTVLVPAAVYVLYLTNLKVQFIFKFSKVSISTLILIFALAGFNTWIMKTKIGHDFRAVGQNRVIAEVAGINVDKTRIIAMVISTVLAGIGQIIRLQDIGTINTYQSHEQIAVLSIAAILVGGATVAKATNRQAFIGVLLFHAIFAVSPQVGNALFADPQVGEFFRTFLGYGIIFVALAMNAKQQMMEQNAKLGNVRPARQRSLKK